MSTGVLPILSLVVLLSSRIAVSDNVVEEWVARYDGLYSHVDTPYAIAVDSLGNSYVTGTSYSDNDTGYDYATIKYSPDGEELWVSRYSGSENGYDIAYDIALDLLGNVYVTGRAVIAGSNIDYVTIKYDDNGDTEWFTIYDGPVSGIDYGVSIAHCQSGFVYVTGTADTPNVTDYATICYDSDGQQQWEAFYDGPTSGFDEAAKLVLDGEGNVVVTGYSSDGGNLDYATVKYSPSGGQLWESRYNGLANGVDASKDVAVDAEGNVYVTGGSHGYNGLSDIATVMYSSDGEEQWVSRYNGLGNHHDSGSAVAVDGEGNVVVTGFTTGIDASYDCITIMYDSSGVEQWIATYEGPDAVWDESKSVVLDDAGNSYITAYSNGDYITIKYDHAGNELWIVSYNGPGDSVDEAVDIALDGMGNIYVTGESRGGTGSYGDEDYATIKYVQTTGYQPSTEAKAASGILLQIFPNPSSGLVEVRFGLSEPSVVNTCVYDLTGRVVYQSMNADHNPGYHSILLDYLPSGIYLCRMISGDFTAAQRFVVIE